jgi:hypothetical protein
MDVLLRPTIRFVLTGHLISPFPLSLPRTLTVINICYRHDFGYRNFKKQARFSATSKARIDSNFKKDMFNQCAKESFRDACEATATVYYEAVKAFGKKRKVEILGARIAEDGAKFCDRGRRDVTSSSNIIERVSFLATSSCRCPSVVTKECS